MLQCSAVSASSGSEVSRKWFVLFMCWCYQSQFNGACCIATQMSVCLCVCCSMCVLVPWSSCMAEMSEGFSARLMLKPSDCKLADRTSAIICCMMRMQGIREASSSCTMKAEGGNSPHRSYPTPAARDPPWGAHRS